MRWDRRGWRSPAELGDDASGQLVVEWALLAATVIMPFGLLAPTMIDMITTYYYRIAGLVSLPFP